MDASQRQIQKKFRLNLIYALVQPLLDKRSNGDIVQRASINPKLHAVRLQR